MNPEQGHDHDEELNDDVPRAPRSLIPGRSRILLVFGVLAVAAIGALVYFRDGGAGPGATKATEPRASSMVGSAPAGKDIPPLAERRDGPPAPASNDAAKSAASSMTASTAPLAGTPFAVAEGPKPATADPKAATTEKKSPPAEKSKAAEKATPTEKESTPAAKTATKDASKSAAPSKTEGARSESETTKSAPAKAAPAKREAASKPAPASDTRGETSGKPYWVQVGAFKDVDTANKVATQLRDMKLRVELSELRTGGGASSAPAPAAFEPPKPGSDRYEVVVTGSSPEDVSTKLTAKGLASQPTPEGAVITPSLPLGEAIALSKDLSGDNLKIKVRRVGGPQAAAAPPPPREIQEKTTRSGETLHRVRVGGFPDRTAALTALRDLETKGYKPFLVRE